VDSQRESSNPFFYHPILNSAYLDDNLASFGRWAFAEFTDIYEIEPDFKSKIEEEFGKMIERTRGNA
jgi:hypothetical protein